MPPVPPKRRCAVRPANRDVGKRVADVRVLLPSVRQARGQSEDGGRSYEPASANQQTVSVPSSSRARRPATA